MENVPEGGFSKSTRVQFHIRSIFLYPRNCAILAEIMHAINLDLESTEKISTFMEVCWSTSPGG